jgi:hypothetical protein
MGLEKVRAIEYFVKNARTEIECIDQLLLLLMRQAIAVNGPI